ncbi:MAG: hypothetical protein RLW62_15945, partial [Gammaproteobacteria bacterium]
VNGDGRDDFHLRERFVIDGRAVVRDHVVFGRAGGLPDVLDTLAEAAAGRAFEILGADAFNTVQGGDVDGDGFADLLIRGATANARYHLVYGSSSMPLAIPLDDLAPAHGYTLDATGQARLVDVNADGLFDIFMPGAVLLGDSARQRGGRLDLRGAARAGAPLLTAAAGPGFELAPDAGADDYPLTDISAIGDFDGDGHGDFFVVAAPPGGITPAFHVVRGGAGGLDAGFDLDRAPRITLTGNLARGGSVVWGDFNGDGLSDIVIVGNAQTDERNEQRVVFGTADRAVTQLDTEALDGRNGFVVSGGWDFPAIGRVREGMQAIALGDVNGDGIDDLGFSSSTHLAAPTHGYLPVLFGRRAAFPAHLDLTVLAADSGFHALLPFDARSTLRLQPRAIGDFDGDGHDDFLVLGDSGSAYLARGRPHLAATLVSGTPGADFIEVHVAGSLVESGDGDDTIHVRNPFGTTIDAGAGNDT